MQARMTHPVMVLPDAMKALLALSKAAQSGTVPDTTHKLIHLRVSQINGCSLCVDMHARELKDAGEKDERIWGVGAWRESPYFSDAERAALALAESVTRLADRPDAVPDAVWADAPDPLVLLTGVLELPRMHVDAQTAAVDLAHPQVDQLVRRVGNGARLRGLAQGEQRLHRVRQHHHGVGHPSLHGVLLLSRPPVRAGHRGDPRNRQDVTSAGRRVLGGTVRGAPAPPPGSGLPDARLVRLPAAARLAGSVARLAVERKGFA